MAKIQVPVVMLNKDGGRNIVGQASLEHVSDGRVEVNMILTPNSKLETLVPFVTVIVASFEARLGG